MAVKEKKPKVKSVVAVASATEWIDLKDICANTAQSRGMGVLPTVQSMGYPIFENEVGAEKDEGEKESLWPMFFGEQGKKDFITSLLKEHEPDLFALAEKLVSTGQLQDIGVCPEDNTNNGNGLDVIFGMRRALAMALAFAAGMATSTKVSAKVFEQELSTVDKKLMALGENDDRKEEGPVDKALTYQSIMKEGKLTAKDLGLLIGYSGQHVGNHLKLLHAKLEDKRLAINKGDLGIDPALALLAKRLGGPDKTRETSSEERLRMPNLKQVEAIYNSKSRPKKMTGEEWELVTHSIWRQWVALRIGATFTEYEAPAEEVNGKVEVPPKAKKPKKAVAEKNGKGEEKPVKEDKPKTIKVIRIKRERAIELLMSLGKMNARTLSDDIMEEMLENMPANLEEGQKAETKSLQDLLDKLVAGYAGGLKVEIFTKDE